MARSLAALFGAGGVLVLATLVLPHDGGQDLGVLVPALLALATAGVLSATAGATSAEVLRAVLALGTLLITACCHFSASAQTAYPMMYLWVALFAAYFFSGPWVGVELGLCAVAYAVVAPDLVHWTMVSGALAVAAVLLARLTAAIRAQAADLTAVTQMASAASDATDVASATCRSLQRSARADVVVLLEALPDGGGLQVTAMAGTQEAGMVFVADRVRAGLQQAFHLGEGVELLAEQATGRLRARAVGWAQPVLRDGRAVGVLAVGWTAPRRSVQERSRSAAALFAAEASIAMGRAEGQRRDRERRALEINDTIVQGLVVAKYSAQLGDLDGAVGAIDETLGRSRQLITDQLQWVTGIGRPIRPGDLARAEASTVGHGDDR